MIVVGAGNKREGETLSEMIGLAYISGDYRGTFLYFYLLRLLCLEILI
jgi:hypothetical protein